MKNLLVKINYIFVFLLTCSFYLNAQPAEKKMISESEKVYIEKTFAAICISDQLYRNKIAKGTLDEKIIAQIDSVFENEGMEASINYEKSLNLSLPQTIQDSLWNLQHQLDLQNHLTLKGLWDTYGYIGEDVTVEKKFVQLLLLMHPPKDWDIRTYLKEYGALLIEEVHAGRMPAKTYARFVDNIRGKILKEPQLYGTNKQYDPQAKMVVLPQIEDLEKSNEARRSIGMPLLKEGEYRLVEN